MTQKTTAHLALLATNIFFAINYTAIKYLVNGGFVKPFGLNLVRVGVSAIMFWALFFFRPRKVVVAKKDVGRFFLCAIAGIAINQLLFVKGLSLTYPIHASLLLLITPILITIFAARILKERLNNFKLMGLAMGIAGALVLVLAKENSGDASAVLLGDVLIFINAVSYTFYFVLVKPLMKAYDPIMVLRIVFTIGFFIILPFCFREFTEISWQAYAGKELTILGLIVIGGTFLAYLFNIYGIKVLGASVAGAYIYSQPLFAATTAVFFLGEELNAYKVFAGILIFAGVYLANKKTNNA